MTFEFTKEGRLVLRGVTDEAWAFLQEARNASNCGERWVVGREDYGGTVYVTVTYTEDKEDVVKLLTSLQETFGLDCTIQAKWVFEAWKEEVRAGRKLEERTLMFTKVFDKCGALKELIRRGCAGCRHLKHVDDDVYCTAGDKPVLLDTSPLSIERGTSVDGVQYWGRKIYPHDECAELRR